MSRETIWLRLSRGVRRLQHRPDWPTFVGPNYADHIMQTVVTDRYFAKQGRSTGRLILSRGNRQLTVYLKRHYRLSWWRGLLAALWPDLGWSPALEEWRHLEQARQFGLPVPASVAAGEFIGPWGRLQSFLAVEELTGMLPLHEAIPAASAQMAPGDFVRWKVGLILELARIARAMHTRHWFHKDLYLCHFFVAEELCWAPHVEDWRGRVHLIDLHRLAHHSWTSRFWQVKDLAQLLFSSDVPGVTDRDRLRFWRAYLGNRRRGAMMAWLRHWVLFRCALYRRHEGRRRVA
jgi:heptose I phosphotransferase